MFNKTNRLQIHTTVQSKFNAQVLSGLQTCWEYQNCKFFKKFFYHVCHGNRNQPKDFRLVSLSFS